MSRHRPVPPPEQLAAALLEHAAGNHADTAAVNLVVAHDLWLRRRDFQQEFLLARYCHPTCPPVVTIRWKAAITALDQGRLPCSGSEANLLRIAASLGTDLPVRLRRALDNFDGRNITLIADAITAANGTQHRPPSTKDDHDF
jgi:hypothetical protein